ncbi:uncharacterized protein EV154DRAFT_416727 [Mucor mucedo]|uniref:uncharacterized protein n=1 Tax=Mucor mucedo TaxID=29922 RepID=UPI00221F2F64|nr:uncharacterized protein EV154DRAFT_416727 [Mucor mucedo]KAI7893551.1 hypothetical protein EV154DRAFT_416727 [Mucor mucedo]
MFGQLCSNDSKNGVSVTTEEDNTSSAILDYYAASENILHTAAVSISSTYNPSHDTLDRDDGERDLLLGIASYEKGELEQASYHWKVAAESESPLGIFFYGLTLRHGWGCRKSPALAVRFLQKAAEYPVFDLQSGINRFISAVKIESLVLSIYELGEFFWHGWEVPKSVAIATYYFQVASTMGNTDAMNDLAFCYKHGHGVEKDDVKAAQLYRLAEEQGNGLKDNSWIWHEQYNDDIEPN